MESLNITMHHLTKSKIITGLQCHKKLWFDIHDPIRLQSHVFYIGNRFGEFARSHYGDGCNLEGIKNPAQAIQLTQEAIHNPTIKVIYEAAFLQMDTLVRVDVMVRKNDSWDIIEVKSSTEVKEVHLQDASVQARILKKSGINISGIKIAYINDQFVYSGNDDYEGLILEEDISEESNRLATQVESWIETLLPIAKKGSNEPQVEMGNWCKAPYECQYQDRCKALLPNQAEIPIEIIPYVGKKLAKKWAEKNVYDLRNLPPSELKNEAYQAIQKAHIENSTWLSPKLIRQVRGYGWPRYFMDFETIQQGVPLIKGTKPYQQIPFQWSVHRWDDSNQELGIEDGQSFLEFIGPNQFRNFLVTLLQALGNKGPIFVHNMSTEKGVLDKLVARDDCKDLQGQVNHVIDRLVDTLPLVREGYYSPIMGTNISSSLYSIKNIVRSIPTTVDYKEAGSDVGSGTDAQIAWFVCTDTKTSAAEKQNWQESLIKYCAKDTLAMVDLIRYFDNVN